MDNNSEIKIRSLNDLQERRRQIKEAQSEIENNLFKDLIDPGKIAMSAFSFINKKRNNKTTKLGIKEDNESTKDLNYWLQQGLNFKSMGKWVIARDLIKKISRTKWFKFQILFLLYIIINEIIKKRKSKYHNLK